jgi:hypothetical protein
MNNHPYILFILAQDRFNDLLHEAEAERRFKQTQSRSVNWLSYIREAVSVARLKLRTQWPAKPTPSIR